MQQNELTIYSRIGCHLCEDMQTLLQTYLSGTGFSFSVVYIDDDDLLQQQFGTLVPVLKNGEKEICHYFLDVKALQQYMSEVGNPLK